MTRFLFVLAFLALLAAPVSAQDAARKWEVLPAKSGIAFSGVEQGKTFEGRFDRFTAEIYFDPENLSRSSATVDIDLASTTTNDATRDKTLLEDDFFKDKTARFETVSFSAAEGGGYIAHGNLTINGIVLPHDLSFTVAITEDKDSGKLLAAMQGSTELERLGFNVGSGDWKDTSVIANLVRVDVKIGAEAPK